LIVWTVNMALLTGEDFSQEVQSVWSFVL